MDEKEKKYDGLTIQDKGGVILTSFNIHDALNQQNPRNLFLNGQLYVEMMCDSIIAIYFGKDNGIKQHPIYKLLHSSHIDFFGKIYFLGVLRKIRKTEKRIETYQLVAPDLLISLKAIGQVRNAFHHNLRYEDALKHVQKGGSKFAKINKKLEDYIDIDTLMKDFKAEVEYVYLELHRILMGL